MHIKVTNNQPETYTIGQLRRDNPQVSFPKNIPDSVLSEYSVYSVVATWPPEGDVVTEGTPELNNGQWVQTWVSRDYTEEEVAQNLINKRAKMSVSPRQARLALLAAGKLSNVETAINALDANTKAAVQIEWEYATKIERTSPWVQSMTTALGMTDTEVDTLFESATNL
jgi:hypothetical protein